METDYRDLKKCDICGVELPAYEAYSFDILDKHFQVVETYQGHEKCIEATHKEPE
ncbi:hypothetical protein ACE41H_21520 [Paenibacillus enshidis]|uniref:Uncharacterized protein n=1 Tax=Paenibacillus enshidis TaxID=1458439 RepID=A0ABV5AZM6_9BACL